MANGNSIIAYKTIEVRDSNGVLLPLDDKYKSNSFGLAVADGDDEVSGFDTFIGW